MRYATHAAVLFSVLLLAACEEMPTRPDAPVAAGEASFARGGNKPGKEPPPPVTDPVVLFSGSTGSSGNGGAKNGNLGTSLYRMNTSGAFERVFSDDVEKDVYSVDPTFAPDGQRFVYLQDARVVQKPRSVSEVFRIATAHFDGTGLQVLHEVDFTAGTLRRPRWSPGPAGGGSSEMIAYLEGTRDDAGAWLGDDLYVMRTDGSGRTRLTRHTETSGGIVRVSRAEWSRSADRILAILWNHDTAEFTRRLYTIDCAAACALTDSIDLDLSAGLAPVDGFGQMDWAHASDRFVTQVLINDRGPGDLWIVDLSDPTAPSLTRLTSTDAVNEGEPAWSADDSEIAFESDADGVVRVYLMNADGTARRAVSAEIGNGFGLDWKP